MIRFSCSKGCFFFHVYAMLPFPASGSARQQLISPLLPGGNDFAHICGHAKKDISKQCCFDERGA
ncbi:MAG: hypothetical protein PHH32_01605, partial [Eubacteriales bacterium]|nr:hypothetical protein [Eubacteriales bacterium]